MFFMFSNRLGCLASLAISAVVSLLILVAMGMVSL